MLTGLVTFFQVLPKLLSVLSQLGKWMQDRQVSQWLDQLEQTMDRVEAAKTPEEKQNAAKALVHTIRSLR